MKRFATWHAWVLACCGGLFLAAGLFLPAGAEEPKKEEDPSPADAPVSFNRDIRPILVEHCQGCHQPAKPSGGLVLTSYDHLRKGGESEEPGVVPGKPEESTLYTYVVAEEGEEPLMPKDAPPLTPAEVEKIRRWILQGAKDDTPQSMKVTYTMDNPPRYQLAPVLTSVDYSPDGKLLAVSGYHEVLIHRADGSGIVARLVGLSERIESAVFSPDGKHLAVTGGSPGRFGEVQIWNLEKKKLELSIQVGFDTIYGASWSHNGRWVAFGCPDNNVRMIDAKTGKQLLQQGAHNDWVLDTVFSSDDSHLVSVSRDMTAKLTEVSTGRFVDNITSITPGALKGGLISVDIRPGIKNPKDDQIVVGGSDGVPQVFRIHRTKERRIGDNFNLIRAFEKMPGRIYGVAFSPDGKRIVAGSSYDRPPKVRLGMGRVYRVEDGKIICQLEQESAIYDVAFSPDGKHVATVGFDGKVRVFDAQSGKRLQEFWAVPLEKVAQAP